MFGNGNAARTVQVIGGECFALEHLRRRALEHHFPTLSSGAGTDVHHIIGGHHHVFVVLHHNHRVAGVAELFERANQSHIVALMETNRGFVENIEHIDQLRTDLRSESDALALAARKGHRRAVEREVVKSHIEEERKARANFFQDLGGDRLLLPTEIFADSIEPFFQFGHIHRGKFGNVLIAKFIRQRLAVETRPFAFGTTGRGVELFCPALRSGSHLGIGHLANVFHHTTEISVIIVAASHARRRDAQQFGRTVEDGIECFVRQFLYGRIDRVAVLFEYRFDRPKDERFRVFPERNKRPFLDAEFRIGTYLFAVDDIHHAQAFALRTSPLRGVEREIVRCGLAVGQPRHGTHEAFGVISHGFIVGIKHEHQAVALRKGLLHTLLESLFVLGLHLEFVNHHFDVVILVTIDAHTGFERAQFTVHTHMDEALLAHTLKEFFVVSFALLHQRREEVDTVVGIVVEEQTDDLFLGVFHHFLPAGIRIGIAGTRIEQTEEVVDFRHRADGGTRIFVGGFLFDADHGRKTADLVYIGPFEIVEKVSGVGRKSFNITTLTFSINGVEGQRRFSATTQSGDNSEGVARDIDVDILEVMHAGTEHLDLTVLKSLVLFCHVVVVSTRTAGTIFFEPAQEIDGFLDVVVAAVGTSRLNIEVIGPVGRLSRTDAAVPSVGGIVPLVYFAPPAVAHQGAETHNTFVALLGFEHIVDAVAVGREGVGKFQFTFGDRDAESLRLGVSHRVGALHKGDQQLHHERAALGEFVGSVGIVACEEGRRVAVATKLPLIERRARTVVGGARFEAHAERRTAVKPGLFCLFAVGCDHHHGGMCRRYSRIGHLRTLKSEAWRAFRCKSFHFVRFHRKTRPTLRYCGEE